MSLVVKLTLVAGLSMALMADGHDLRDPRKS
jgi:hypothetical protein